MKLTNFNASEEENKNYSDALFPSSIKIESVDMQPKEMSDSI